MKSLRLCQRIHCTCPAVYAANHLEVGKSTGGVDRKRENTKTDVAYHHLTYPSSLCPDTKATLNTMALFRGVKPVFFDSRGSEPGQLKQDVIAIVLKE